MLFVLRQLYFNEAVKNWKKEKKLLIMASISLLLPYSSPSTADKATQRPRSGHPSCEVLAMAAQPQPAQHLPSPPLPRPKMPYLLRNPPPSASLPSPTREIPQNPHQMSPA